MFLGGLGAQQRHDLSDRGGQQKRDRFEFEFAALDFGEIEDVVQQPHKRVGGTGGDFNLGALVEVEWRLLEHLQHAHDTVHRRADLVAHCRKELALRAAGGLGAHLCLARRDEQFLVFENQPPQPAQIAMVKAGGVEQEECVGDRDETKRPRARLRQRKKAREQGRQRGDDIEPETPRHRSERTGSTGVQANEDDHKQQPREKQRSFKIEPSGAAPDEAGNDDTDAKRLPPRRQVLLIRSETCKGDPEGDARCRHQHDCAEPFQVQRPRLGVESARDKDDRKRDVGKQAKTRRTVEQARHLGLDLAVNYGRDHGDAGRCGAGSHAGGDDEQSQTVEKANSRTGRPSEKKPATAKVAGQMKCLGCGGSDFLDETGLDSFD